MNIAKSSHSIQCISAFAFALTTLQTLISTSLGDPLLSYLPKLPLMFLGYFISLAILRGISGGIVGFCISRNILRSQEVSTVTDPQNLPPSSRATSAGEALFYAFGFIVFIAAQTVINT